MFDDIRNTGDDHWGASSGVPPSQSNLSCDNSHINLDDEEEADNDDDSEPEQVTPTSLRLRGKRAPGPVYNKGKKPKTNTGHWLKEHMGKIVEMNERTTASCESMARREAKVDCTIHDVMTLVEECGAKPRTDEHFIATVVFTKRVEREMFMTLKTPEDRFDWLRRKHEWFKARRDVS
jgi:hypothetical protein